MAEDQAYLVEQSGGLLTLTFNRPEQGNAISSESTLGIASVFKNAQADPSVRAILINGRGKHFSTGGNLSAFAEEIARGPDYLRDAFQSRMGQVAEMVEALVAFDRPIVAAIRGGVAGAGLLFALVADLAIGDETAFFLFAHQRVGLSPDGGVSYLLPRVVGTREARRLLFTAAKVDAPEAKELGLLTSIVSGETLDAEAVKLAQRFTKSPQRAIRTAKQLLGASLDATLSAQLTAEAAGIVDCVCDPDFAEGVHSFLEKRPTKFPSAS